MFVCAGWEQRSPRRRKVKFQPSSSQTRAGAASDSDSDSDSNKASSVSSEDSHHSSGMPGPTPMDLEEEGMVNCSVLLVVVMLLHRENKSSFSYKKCPIYDLTDA